MYIEQDQVPVVEGLGAFTPEGQWVPGPPVPGVSQPSPWCPARTATRGLGAAVPPAWYMKDDASKTFFKALQASLGTPQTGVWDKTTHDTLWNWVMAREAQQGPSDMPSVLPWKQQICTSDGFPPFTPPGGGAATDCVETATVIGESLDHYLEANPTLLMSLGWPSETAMHEDTVWQQYKEGFGINLMAHIRSQLGVSQEPCPEGQWRSADGTCVPLVTVVPVTPVVKVAWYKRPGVLAAGAGVVVLAGVVIAMAVSRRRG